MKLTEILTEYGMWTAQLSDLVHGAIQYHAKRPDSEEGRILRNNIAPMLSHAHDNPKDIEYPEEFKHAVDVIRSSILNPALPDLKYAVELLNKAMPNYHDTHERV